MDKMEDRVRHNRIWYMKVKKSSPDGGKRTHQGFENVDRADLQQLQEALANAQYVSTKRSIIRLLHESLPESERYSEEPQLRERSTFCSLRCGPARRHRGSIEEGGWILLHCTHRS
jgi:hypothetical protein